MKHSEFQNHSKLCFFRKAKELRARRSAIFAQLAELATKKTALKQNLLKLGSKEVDISDNALSKDVPPSSDPAGPEAAPATEALLREARDIVKQERQLKAESRRQEIKTQLEELKERKSQVKSRLDELGYVEEKAGAASGRGPSPSAVRPMTAPPEGQAAADAVLASRDLKAAPAGAAEQSEEMELLESIVFPKRPSTAGRSSRTNVRLSKSGRLVPSKLSEKDEIELLLQELNEIEKKERFQKVFITAYLNRFP